MHFCIFTGVAFDPETEFEVSHPVGDLHTESVKELFRTRFHVGVEQFHLRYLVDGTHTRTAGAGKVTRPFTAFFREKLAGVSKLSARPGGAPPEDFDLMGGEGDLTSCLKEPPVGVALFVKGHILRQSELPGDGGRVAQTNEKIIFPRVDKSVDLALRRIAAHHAGAPGDDA